mgnify:CR=1 FL=1
MNCCNTQTPIYKKIFYTLTGISSHDGEVQQNTKGLDKIALLGSPNVGKSVLFNALTGAYVTVSNYPGTTVEVSRGKSKIKGKEYEVIDTPGMYSFMCITDEEKVTRNLLLNERPKLVIHVIDAKNLQRMLPITFQLIEGGLPVMLVLNIMDEAKKAGISIDIEGLEQELGIPVIPTVASKKKGLDTLTERIDQYVNNLSH